MCPQKTESQAVLAIPSGRRHISWATGIARAAATMLLVAAPAQAVEVTGQLTLGSVYTNNITLAPAGEEDGGFVLIAEPSIAIASTGLRYDFRLDYLLQALNYPNQPDSYYQDPSPQSSEFYSQGTVSLDLELLEEHLFLNSAAGTEQVPVDPAQPFTFNNIAQIGNRSNATQYQFGPEWRQGILGSSLVITTAAGHVDYSDEALQDTDYQTIETVWDGPLKDRGLSWSLRHAYEAFEYEASPDAKDQLLDVSLFLNLAGGWAPFATGGMESDINDPSNAALKDGIWAVGVRRTTARSAFEASGGRRSFGSTWAGSFEYRYGNSPADFIRAFYSEEPETTEGIDDSLAFPAADPGEPPPPPGPALPPDLVAPGTGFYFLQKSGGVAVSRSFNRNTVAFNVFYDKTINIPQQGLTNPGDNVQAGASARWVYQLGARTNLILDAYGANRDFNKDTPAADSDTQLRGRLSCAYQLGLRTLLTGWVAHDQIKGSSDDDNNYSESQVGVTVGRSF